MPVSIMLFKIASLVAGSTGLLESKSSVSLNGLIGSGFDGLVGTKSCIKLQRAFACDEGNELRMPTRLSTAAAAQTLSRMTIVPLWRAVARMIVPLLHYYGCRRAALQCSSVGARQFVLAWQAPANQ